MKLSLITGILGWTLGVHAPWFICLSLCVVLIVLVSRDKASLEDVLTGAMIGLPFCAGMLLSSLIYGDIGTLVTTIDFKWIFTGE